jgi:hypothetical protein
VPKRIPTQTVIVYRDKKQVVPPIGEVFDFTRQEVDEIKSVAPDALRLPINEENLPGAPDTPEEDAEHKEAREAKARADAKLDQGRNAQSAAQRSNKALHLSGREGDKSREEGDL